MDQRHDFRVAASGRIDCRIGQRTLEGALYNLSQVGCMIESTGELPDVGEPVEITLLRDVTARGRVAWVRSGGFGVTFDQKIGEATVRYFRLTDWSVSDDIEPTDGFGRSLRRLKRR